MKKLITEPLVHFLVLGLPQTELSTALVHLLRSAEDNRVHWSSLTVPASYANGAVASSRMIDRVTGFWI